MPINVTAVTAEPTPFGGEIILNISYSGQWTEGYFLFVARKRTAWTTPEKNSMKTAITNGTYEELVANSWKSPTAEPSIRYIEPIDFFPSTLSDINRLKNGTTYYYYLIPGLQTSPSTWDFGTEGLAQIIPESDLDFTDFDGKSVVVEATRHSLRQVRRKSGELLEEGIHYEIATSYPKTPIPQTILFVVSRANGDNNNVLLDYDGFANGGKTGKIWTDTDVYRVEWRCVSPETRDMVTRVMKANRIHYYNYFAKFSGSLAAWLAVGGDNEELHEEGGAVIYIGYMTIRMDTNTTVILQTPTARGGTIQVNTNPS